jgi:hypothetical protein
MVHLPLSCLKRIESALAAIAAATRRLGQQPSRRQKFFSDRVPLADFMTFAAWISQPREVD